MEKRSDIDLKWLAFALLALLAAMGLKAWLVAAGWVPFNSDEAVVALMARHILAGARPVFFYGQAYMGSLDAFLVAGAFATFGQQVWAIRLVQSCLYLGVLLTTAWLGKAAFDSWRVGLLALVLLAIPTVNVTLYTTVSLGGYGEALLLGNLTLLVGLRIARGLRETGMPGPYGLWAGLGLLSGLGLWAFGLTLVFSLPVIVYLSTLSARLFLDSAKSAPSSQENIGQGVGPGRAALARGLALAAGTLLAGGLLGSLPWWGYALENGFEKLLWELSGGAIAGVEQMPWIFQVGRHLMSLMLLGVTVTFGFRPPWGVNWLALPLLPFMFLFWMAVVIFLFRCLRKESCNRGPQALVAGVMLTLLLGFVLTPFGADPSGRYFVPLAVPLALFAAAMILSLEDRIGGWAYGLAAFVLIFNLWGTMQSARRFPPGITTQFYAPAQVDHRYDDALMAFLRQHGENRGYGNYWVAYPLAFLSQEQLIFTPRLPYHLDFRYTLRDDRYAPYDEWVAQADRVAYITTRHPELNQRLRAGFSNLGVDWQEAKFGDYTLFYALSRPVRPEELGLGATTNP
ncbi:MAG: hypothetical protein JXA78_05630 [Anaerolineales bacterium]|nr:hypothetical protein [Anaerolineales bacterium]